MIRLGYGNVPDATSTRISYLRMDKEKAIKGMIKQSHVSVKLEIHGWNGELCSV
jgi:hypothetical protein